jgi:hypothetical protein
MADATSANKDNEESATGVAVDEQQRQSGGAEGKEGGEGKEGEEGDEEEEEDDGAMDNEEELRASSKDAEIRLLKEPLDEDERGLDVIELNGQKYVLGISLQKVTKRCHNLYQSIRRLVGYNSVMSLRSRSKASEFLREKGLLERKFKQKITIVRLDALRALKSHRAVRRARNMRRRRYNHKHDGASHLSSGSSSSIRLCDAMVHGFDDTSDEDDDDMDTIIIDLSPYPTPSPPSSPSPSTHQQCSGPQKENVVPRVGNVVHAMGAIACK